MKEQGFLEGNEGFSMRRLLALIFSISSVCAGITSIVLIFIGFVRSGVTIEHAWLIVLVSWLCPGIIALLMMFFTTWSDVAKAVKSVRS